MPISYLQARKFGSQKYLRDGTAVSPRRAPKGVRLLDFHELSGAARIKAMGEKVSTKSPRKPKRLIDTKR